MIIEVSPSANVVLDGSGNGQCAVYPPSGTKLAPRLATLAVSTSAKQPQGFLYRGSASGPQELIDSTYTGAQASSSKVGGALYYSGQWLWAVWKGGDPGATATLQVYGQQGGRTDPLPLSPPGEGFANPVVAGTALIIPAINSPNFVVDTTGWSINQDGSAEFDNITLRGVVKDLLRIITGNIGAQALGIRDILDTVDRLTIRTDGRIDWGSGGSATDTDLYRASAGVLQTDSNFVVNNGTLTGQSSTPGAIVLAAQEVGDTQPRWSVTRAGSMMGGSGSAAPDVSFVRTAVGIWVSDQIKFNVSGAAETWHGMSGGYAAGWSDHGAGYSVGQYRKCPSPAGVVEVLGYLNTTAPTISFFTLPAGYRPLAAQRIPAWSDLTTPVAIDVSNTGTMIPIGATGATQLAFHAFIATDA